MKIIGLGNEFRHDDAVGLIAARRIRELGVAAEERNGEAVSLIESWEGADGVILIDSIVSGAAPGRLHCLDVSATSLDASLFRSSTHALGLADAIELARALGALPPRVLVFGVEAGDVSPGIGLSTEVESTLPELVARVLESARSFTDAIADL